MFSQLGPTELIVIFAIALLLFGSRLPSVGRSLGEGIRNFKKGLANDEEEKSNSNSKSTKQDTQSTRPPHSGSGPVIAQAVQPKPLNGDKANGSQSPKRDADVVDVEHRDANH